MEQGPDDNAQQSGPAIPVARMVESIIGCKWSLRILGLIAQGHLRPSALLRETEGLSAKVMNERLKKMLRFGIAQRRVIGDKPPIEVEYSLTEFGQQFMTIIEAVRELQQSVDAGQAAASPDSPTAPGGQESDSGNSA